MGTLHPQITHFPIALIITAFIFQIVAVSKPSWVCRSTPLWILGIAVVTALFSLLTGEQAAHLATEAGSLGISAQTVLDRHERFATYTSWISLLVFVGWVWSFLRFRGDRRVDLVAVFLLFLLSLSVAITGYLGGELVLSHGVGVEM